MENLNKAKRSQRKINSLGIRNPKCQICGEDNLFTLEKHHIPGGHNGEEIIVCANCHRKLTDGQLDWPPDLLAKTRLIEDKIIAFFEGLADILELLADICRKYTRQLYEIMQEKKVV